MLRNLELMLISCLCGASFIGTEADFDQHLEMDCPVFEAARDDLARR